MKTLVPMLKRMCRPDSDTVICGSDEMALTIRSALVELGLDYHVIADDEISPQRFYVTSQAALSSFPGGGRN